MEGAAASSRREGNLFQLLQTLAWVSGTLLLAFFFLSRDLAFAKEQFLQVSTRYFEQIVQKVQTTETALEGFAALFHATGSDGSDTSAARLYARQVLKRYPHIHALQVTRQVPRAELERFIRLQRRISGPDFQVRDYSRASMTWRPVEPRSIYYPIVFQEPEPGNGNGIIGLDAGADFGRNNAMTEAVRRDQAVSSYPFKLIEGVLGYSIFHPYRHAASNPAMGAEVGEWPLNVQLIVNAEKLAADAVLAPDARLSVHVYHKDFSADQPAGRLHAVHAEPSGWLERQLFPEYRFARTIALPGGPFTVDIRQQAGWRDLNPELVLIVGMMMLASFGSLAWFQRNSRIARRLELENAALLAHQACHDYLTGLVNRREFMKRADQSLARALRRKEKLGVLYFDLNGFKGVNDTLGHEAGDALLKAVADRLSTATRMEDVVARFGGDEFVVLVEGAHSTAELQQAAEKIAGRVCGQVRLADQEVAVQTSVGYASFPDDGTEIHALLECADQRMYRNKRDRRGANLPTL